MIGNPSVEVAALYFAALRNKDLSALPLAADVVMESPLTPRLCGLESVLEYLEALASIIKTIRTVDFIAQDNKVAFNSKSKLRKVSFRDSSAWRSQMA